MSLAGCKAPASFSFQEGETTVHCDQMPSWKLFSVLHNQSQEYIDKLSLGDIV